MSEVRKFRKKPVVVEAMQFVEPPDAAAIAAWVFRHGGSATAALDGYTLEIPTLEGTMRADVGDWIIRGTEGEFYPCKPAPFAATFAPVDE